MAVDLVDRLRAALDAQVLRQLAHVLERLDAPGEVEHGSASAPRRGRPRPRTGGICPRARRRSSDSRGCPCRSRPRPSPPLPSSSSTSMIVVILSKPAASASGCTPKSTRCSKRLHVGTVDDLVGELLEPGLALEQQDRHAELHAELRLQLVARAMVDQRVRHVVVGADRDALHALRSQIVATDEIQHHGHARMRERSAGMRLDRDARETRRSTGCRACRRSSRRCSRRPRRGRSRDRLRARWATR